jgi:SpoVK/Ycf46/Vps4 family AAA+-type ATPase
MPLPFERSELVVPPQVASELDLAIAWVRHRHQVLHDWGFVQRVPMGHGLTALFAGPSGTGKTMAAQVLAKELGLDLHRIDASQLVSKWVGETEKNIAMAFGARVGVLFFDEADALFGKRGEAKSPQDRWANIEIGFLLQRMEEYDGVTILATNRMQDMDEAFLRRLHVVVDFPLPSEADRLRIWRGMLPAAPDREPDLDLESLAREFEISGGEIKNAVLAAAYLAAAESKPIGMEHLRRAATRELVKSGKVVER